MAKRRFLAFVILGLGVLGGCARGTVQDALGMGKRSPDEFAVVSRAPLVMPPDYRLRPPQPGAPRPNEATAADQARATLTGRPEDGAANNDQLTVGATPRASIVSIPAAATTPTAMVSTPGEQALLARAGVKTADPNVRRKIAKENLELAQIEQELFTKLMKWRQPASLGATVDPAAETQRLRDNRTEGKPPTAGETPTVLQRRQSALQEFIGNLF